mmetsp:Transcript_34065/g.82487  ORF Transcript_34065/g.82487 Transcript_34065/m.82487 type:complete len:155 (+) Transcript_34065:156-620(+)
MEEGEERTSPRRIRKKRLSHKSWRRGSWEKAPSPRKRRRRRRKRKKRKSITSGTEMTAEIAVVIVTGGGGETVAAAAAAAVAKGFGRGVEIRIGIEDGTEEVGTTIATADVTEIECEGMKGIEIEEGMTDTGETADVMTTNQKGWRTQSWKLLV